MCSGPQKWAKAPGEFFLFCRRCGKKPKKNWILPQSLQKPKNIINVGVILGVGPKMLSKSCALPQQGAKPLGPGKKYVGAGVQWAPKMVKSRRVNFFWILPQMWQKTKNVVNVVVVLGVGPKMLWKSAFVLIGRCKNGQKPPGEFFGFCRRCGKKPVIYRVFYLLT